jgi:hypothetical protein
MSRLGLSLATLLIAAAPAHADEPDGPAQPVRTREYRAVFAPGYDLRTEAVAGPTLHRMAQDVYLYGISPHLNPTVDDIFGAVWSFASAYSALLWPHEFGHWSRAHQVDSTFIFHDLNPLLPNTTVEMADGASIADEALLSVGGFEVNTLVARQTQLDFYRNGGAWSDELVLGMLNESFFSFYTLIFPADPDEPDTWIHTRGDPVHSVLPVYERYTGRAPIRADGSVDPELAGLYREYVWLSLGWTLLDPGFLQQAAGFFDSGFESRRAWMPIRTERFGWTWGTQFNPSPLGYELNLSQYLIFDERIFEVSVKAGRPFHNYGVRVHAPDVLEAGRWRVGGALEGWSQSFYGLGGSAELEGDVRLFDGFGLTAVFGYKTEGYALGRAIEGTFFGGVGLTFAFEHGRAAGPEAVAAR